MVLSEDVEIHHHQCRGISQPTLRKREWWISKLEKTVELTEEWMRVRREG